MVIWKNFLSLANPIQNTDAASEYNSAHVITTY